MNDGSHDLLVGGLAPEASTMSPVGYLECPSRTNQQSRWQQRRYHTQELMILPHAEPLSGEMLRLVSQYLIGNHRSTVYQSG